MIEKAEHTLEYVSISKSSQTPKEPLYVDLPKGQGHTHFHPTDDNATNV